MHALEFNQNGIAMFATQQHNLKKVWWSGMHEAITCESGSSVEALLKAAGLHDHKVVKSALAADYSGDLQKVLSLTAEDVQGMNHSTLRAMVKRAIDGSGFTELGMLVNRENDRKHLSIMSPEYREVQLLESFGVLDELVSDGQIQLESVGSLRGGKSTFMSAKLTGESLHVVDGDLMDQYITVLDSYDGFSRLHILATAIMVVCLNTFRAALADAKRSGKIASRTHRGGMFGASHLDEIREALGLVREQFEATRDLYQRMALVKVTEKEAEGYFRKLILGDNSETELEQNIDGKWSWSGQARRAIGEAEYMYNFGPGADLRHGTVHGLVQAVTAWTTHLKKHKGTWGEDRTTFSLLGNGAKINEEAHQLARVQWQLAA